MWYRWLVCDPSQRWSSGVRRFGSAALPRKDDRLDVVDVEQPSQVVELLRQPPDGSTPVILWGLTSPALWEPLMGQVHACQGQTLQFAGLPREWPTPRQHPSDLPIMAQAFGCALILPQLTDLQIAARMVQRFWGRQTLTSTALLRAMLHDLPTSVA
jgi:hypothetical protein